MTGPHLFVPRGPSLVYRALALDPATPKGRAALSRLTLAQVEALRSEFLAALVEALEWAVVAGAGVYVGLTVVSDTPTLLQTALPLLTGFLAAALPLSFELARQIGLAPLAPEHFRQLTIAEAHSPAARAYLRAVSAHRPFIVFDAEAAAMLSRSGPASDSAGAATFHKVSRVE